MDAVGGSKVDWTGCVLTWPAEEEEEDGEDGDDDGVDDATADEPSSRGPSASSAAKQLAPALSRKDEGYQNINTLLRSLHFSRLQRREGCDQATT